ncbi:MAG: uroporphyrinogen methyltransferase / synthase [Actinomycetota bacterium]|jgi:uroporphyrinogen III methyltransferase/synthase|nr:uroporphyrinogen methyltransferase / synthase [Actinomycetota bacterium]
MTAIPGTVYLVGAGPGDPGLITVRGLELLRSCDVVLHDRLVAPQLLDEAPPGAERIFVGKRAGETHSRQVVSDALLVSKAREGKSVVRLKGGDPFVFGRGAEEAALLRDASIPFEVVPGVSSAIAVPAYAGIPVTHRGMSASFVVLTAREEGGEIEADVSELSVGAETLVLLMGVSALDKITRRLVESGRDPNEPAAAIEWGTTGRQRVVVATLATIAERAEAEGISPPATTVIGPVVALRESLDWFGARPLLGMTVAVTRPPAQSRELTKRFTELGAEVVALPLIGIAPPASWDAADAAIGRLGEYAWVVFASANAVDRFFERLEHAGKDARAFSGAKIAAVGERTALQLGTHALRADLVPDHFTGSALVEKLGEGSGRVLFPRVEAGPSEPVEALVAKGWAVDDAAVYSNVPAAPDPSAIDRVHAGEVDFITLTSASTAHNLVSVVGDTGRAAIVCIGPSTADAARSHGLEVAAVAQPHDSAGLVTAVLELSARTIDP